MEPWKNSTLGLVFISSIYAVRNLPKMFRPEPRTVSYDDQFRDFNDGCAKHDDVWGA